MSISKTTPLDKKQPDQRNTRSFRRGISLLELTVTLVIVALITFAIVSLMNNTSRRIQTINKEVSRLVSLQHCLDLIISDLTTTTSETKIEIKTASLPDGRDTSRLNLNTYVIGDTKKLLHSIDWVSSPRYEEQDMVLYRREKKQSRDAAHNKYIPMCENLCSFYVETLSAQQQQMLLDPNSIDTAGSLPSVEDDSMLMITATIYRGQSRDPDRVFTVVRSFSMKRFEL